MRIFSHEADGDVLSRALDLLHHGGPLAHIRLFAGKPQPAADNVGKSRLFQHQRRFIQAGEGAVFNDALRRHIAEQGDLLKDGGFQRFVTAQHNDVRVDAHALQLLDGVLGGLGLVLVRAGEEGHQRHMDKYAVLPACLQRYLARGLQKGLTFNVPDGAADLGDDDVGPGLVSHAVDEILDLVGDVGDDLYRGAQILTPPLLVQHVPVDLAGGEVGEAVEVFVDEALIVAEVEIRLRAILGDEDFPVLIRAHGAGVNIDIRVKLLRRDLETPRLQESSKGCGGDSLAEPRHHAAGDKDIFGHIGIPPNIEDSKQNSNRVWGQLCRPKHSIGEQSEPSHRPNAASHARRVR